MSCSFSLLCFSLTITRMGWKRSETWNGKETKINKSLNKRILVNITKNGKNMVYNEQKYVTRNTTNKGETDPRGKGMLLLCQVTCQTALLK